jgi:hypothetical protein
MIEQIYKFKKKDFNQNGINIHNGQLFCNLIYEWRKDFHNRNSFFYANYLFANRPTMMLLDKCLNFIAGKDIGLDCGMELVEDEIDLETNFKIEEHSDRRTIYAIGDEPLFLIVDNDIGNGIVVLKYIPDNDSDNNETIIPVESDLVKTNK